MTFKKSNINVYFWIFIHITLQYNNGTTFNNFIPDFWNSDPQSQWQEIDLRFIFLICTCNILFFADNSNSFIGY